MPDDLDPSSPVPLYLQLAGKLREGIASGEITGRLPSETDLQQRYGVARNTARKAVAQLVADGIAEASFGRGVFLVEQPGDETRH